MKGLLVKDFQILRQSSRILLLLAIVFLFLGVTSEDSTFIIGYCTFCLSSLVTSTVSYDDYDNGFSFLFTLPITRRMYVWEKYLLALMFCTVSSSVSAGIGILISAVKNGEPAVMENLLTALIVCLVCLIMVSVMLPLQMKFGAEKSKTLMFGLIAIVLVLGYVFSAVMTKLEETGVVDSAKIAMLFENISGGMLLTVLVAATALIVGITIAISMRVMAKKQM